LGGDVDGACLAVGMVAGEGSFHSGGETRAEMGVGEDLEEVRWSTEAEGGGCLKEVVSSEV
jgi:hypothetical protein